MAIDQSPMTRQISLPATNVNTGNGLNQLSNATQAVSNLITERLNDAAISKAATQGDLDVQEGRQPEKLALPLTRATKAYNTAVTNTEARRLVQTGEQMINESLANSKNPATFNSGTPAKFHSEIEGIKSGILEAARPENREHVREALDRLSAHASLNMLQHSIDFDNQQAKFNMQKDITGLLEARRNAAISGDAERIAGIDQALEQTIGDYSTMNAQIARIAPYLKQDIAAHKEVDKALGGYADALHNKTTAQYLSDLAENKQKLPFNVWQDAVKAVVALDQTESRLKNDINAQQVAQVELGIQNGTIQNEADIMNYPELTVPQQLGAMKALNRKQAEQMKQGAQYITAQQNILSDRAKWNSADTKNKMFQSQIQAFEQKTGKVATLIDMEQSVLGKSQFAASGMPGIGMGTNVPAFDATMSGKLTSKDPVATAQAAMVYNDMVNVQGKPNSINLSGDALAVATLFGELNNGGTTPEQAAQQAIDVVLNAKEPEIAARIEKFHRTLEKIDPRTGSNLIAGKFKEAFGESPKAFGSDEAFKLFQDTYRANYISSNSEEAAYNATKYAMRAWGTSKYFDKGFVGQPVPEKEVPITNVGNAFDNQIVSNLQGYINRNKAAREANPGLNLPVIEWANSKQTITGTESEQDKVFKRMTLGNHPRIKINGHETDVVLMPSATSRLGEGVNYLFGVYDQFNNLNPLKDATNPVDQVARFAPKELSLWAPAIATEQTDKSIREVALKVQQQEMQQDTGELKALEKKTPAWQVIFGLAKPDDYLEYINSRRANTNQGRLDQIIDSLKGKSPAVRDDITDADNVGVSMDLSGAVVPGNIDLSTRPRVKNPDGKISTVRTIGVNFDGLEYVIPTVRDDGKLLSNKEAIELFKRTKKHLGAFKTAKEATDFAKTLHESEAAKITSEGLE